MSLVAFASLFGASCETSSTGPSAASKGNFAGIWQVSVNGTFSSGFGTPGRGTATTIFRLSQQASVVSGIVLDVDTTGVVNADGSVMLSGTTSQFGLTGSVRAMLRPTSNSSGFTGTVAGGFWSFVDATILDAHRVAFDTSTSSFSGTWEGKFGVQDCSFVGWTYCYPFMKGTTGVFYLQLVQVGSSVSGKFVRGYAGSPAPGDFDIPVTGTVSGNHLTLQGSLFVPPQEWREDIDGA